MLCAGALIRVGPNTAVSCAAPGRARPAPRVESAIRPRVALPLRERARALVRLRCSRREGLAAHQEGKQGLRQRRRPEAEYRCAYTICAWLHIVYIVIIHNTNVVMSILYVYIVQYCVQFSVFYTVLYTVDVSFQFWILIFRIERSMNI